MCHNRSFFSASVLSCSSLCEHSFAFLLSFAAGALKDISGTYVTSFRFLGVTEFVAASILASLPFLCRLQQKLEAKRDKRAENNDGHEVVPLASALSNDS